MFNFAVKKVTPSTESSTIVAKEGDLDPSRSYSIDSSNAARSVLSAGAFRGIVSALAKLLVMRGEKKEVITTKLNELILAGRRAGDVDKEYSDWILNCDWYANTSEFVPCYCTQADSMYSFFYDILQDAKCARSFVADCSASYRRNMTEEERSILDNYEKTRKAYFDALRIRDEYFEKRSLLVFHDIMKKYSNIISRIDSEFYEFMSSRVDERVNQLEQSVERCNGFVDDVPMTAPSVF